MRSGEPSGTVSLQTVFAKGAHYGLEQLATADYDVVGLDWTMDPEQSR